MELAVWPVKVQEVHVGRVDRDMGTVLLLEAKQGKQVRLFLDKEETHSLSARLQESYQVIVNLEMGLN